MHSKPTTQEEADLKHSARFIRDIVGIDFDELQSICDFYSVDTISGIGDTQICTPSPDKLVGNGFLVDYITFVTDTGIENDFVPDAAKQRREAADSNLVLPPIRDVFWKIADSLGSRHLKLSDCLNQGEMQSTKWNRTIYGRIPVRKVHSSLSNMLEIQLSDLELCSIAMACPADDGIRIEDLLKGKFQVVDSTVILEKEIGTGALQKLLDKSELSVKLFQDSLKQVTDFWRPTRATGISQKQ